MNMKFAVIGDPIKHSLSPVMQNAGIKKLGIDGEYFAKHVAKDELPEFCDYARNELSGFNITVPHKNNIIPFLDEISNEARLAESVNTVLIENGKMSGFTTDGYGLATAINEAFGIGLEGQSFTFLGCGGAVQAVAFYFAGNGAKTLNFINRTVEKAEALASRLNDAFSGTSIDVSPLSDEDKIKSFIDNSSVLIQGTSLGLKPDDPPPINPEFLTSQICYYDTIYKNTPLMKYARENNIKCADGRSMLLHQGAKALSIWLKKEAPVEVMRKALYDAMDQRAKEG
jgi:shikimate dehydrogenase